ncbi:hypothetical protein [Nonomuraea sp. CA-141351]|uniref:hypothetical protein n=1 Tax=Nonomuraea sp. CA-141351 TaxID=3239996 RepID=UPI003D8D4C0F
MRLPRLDVRQHRRVEQWQSARDHAAVVARAIAAGRIEGRRKVVERTLWPDALAWAEQSLT